MRIVLLPGMDGTGELFESFVSLIEERFSVIVVRYPTTEPWGYTELKAFARSALPNEEPFVILGESFSGPIAISLANSCSTQLKGIILCCSFARNPHPFFSIFQPLVSIFPISIVPKVVLNFFLLGQFATATLRSTLSHAVSEVSSVALKARLKAVLKVNVSDELASITVPILCLCASHDRVVPRRAAELITQLNPRARVKQIDAPHFLLQAAPAEASNVIGTFIQEVQNAL